MLRQSILRSCSTLASMTMSNQMSPFNKTVVEVMRKLYPEALADKSFDNTGLLLEAPYNKHQEKSVLLTIDLTRGVVDEAIKRKDSIIIAYHPIIFRPLKSLTFENSQQASLLRLAQQGISVYSPHTALDAAPGGLNDWLARCLVLDHDSPLESAEIAHESDVIVPVTDVPGMEGAGYGRVLRFEKPERLGTLLGRIRHNLNLHSLSVAVPQSIQVGLKSNMMISSVGMCAGSGASFLKGLDVDMFFTGELSHHDTLAAIESGKVIVTAFHSNTERAFLRERLGPQLQSEICKWTEDPGFSRVAISEVDKEPFEIVQDGQEQW